MKKYNLILNNNLTSESSISIILKIEEILGRALSKNNNLLKYNIIPNVFLTNGELSRMNQLISENLGLESLEESELKQAL